MADYSFYKLKSKVPWYRLQEIQRIKYLSDLESMNRIHNQKHRPKQEVNKR